MTWKMINKERKNKMKTIKKIVSVVLVVLMFAGCGMIDALEELGDFAKDLNELMDEDFSDNDLAILMQVQEEIKIWLNNNQTEIEHFFQEQYGEDVPETLYSENFNLIEIFYEYPDLFMFLANVMPDDGGMRRAIPAFPIEKLLKDQASDLGIEYHKMMQVLGLRYADEAKIVIAIEMKDGAVTHHRVFTTTIKTK